MQATIEADTVGRKASHGGRRPGSGRPRSDRDDVTVKLDRAIVARARFIAGLRKLTLAEYLSESVRPIVDRAFAKAVRGTSSNPSPNTRPGE